MTGEKDNNKEASQKGEFTSWLPEDELWRGNHAPEPHAINVENWDPTPGWVNEWIDWYTDPSNDGKKYW